MPKDNKQKRIGGYVEGKGWVDGYLKPGADPKEVLKKMGVQMTPVTKEKK